MKKKFKTALSEKCKDFGLTEKALDDLTELGIKGMKDDASDEDIAQAGDLTIALALLRLEGNLDGNGWQHLQGTAEFIVVVTVDAETAKIEIERQATFLVGDLTALDGG